MSKKMIAMLGVAGFLATTGVAFAQTTTAAATPASQPMVLEVGQGGKALLRGKISAVSSGSVTVTSWGGDWTVNVPSGAQVLPQGTALSSFQTGDFVGVQGSVDSSASWTINATLIRDWTARKALTQEIKTNRQEAHAAMTAGPRTIQGTLSNLDATAQTFTLTNASGAAYAVTLKSGAEIVGKNFATITLDKVTSGDTVRVYGTVSSTTIDASVFRDVSVK